MEAKQREPMTAEIAERVRELRNAQGLSARALADRCAELGMPGLNRRVLSNLENGKRTYVTVAELFVLAAALHTTPTNLALPADSTRFVRVLPITDTEAQSVRDWIYGRRPLGANADIAAFLASTPPDERARLRSSSNPVVKLARRLTDIVPLAVQRSHSDPYWTPERMADELEKYLPEFNKQVAELIRELRAANGLGS